jgi:hypothetical protein
MGPLERSHPYAHMAGMGAVGGITYAAALLYLPIKGIESEAARWRARARTFGNLANLAKKRT